MVRNQLQRGKVTHRSLDPGIYRSIRSPRLEMICPALPEEIWVIIAGFLLDGATVLFTRINPSCLGPILAIERVSHALRRCAHQAIAARGYELNWRSARKIINRTHLLARGTVIVTEDPDAYNLYSTFTHLVSVWMKGGRILAITNGSRKTSYEARKSASTLTICRSRNISQDYKKIELDVPSHTIYLANQYYYIETLTFRTKTVAYCAQILFTELFRSLFGCASPDQLASQLIAGDSSSLTNCSTDARDHADAFFVFESRLCMLARHAEEPEMPSCFDPISGHLCPDHYMAYRRDHPRAIEDCCQNNREIGCCICRCPCNLCSLHLETSKIRTIKYRDQHYLPEKVPLVRKAGQRRQFR